MVKSYAINTRKVPCGPLSRKPLLVVLFDIIYIFPESCAQNLEPNPESMTENYLKLFEPRVFK
jgi:hypothetical protein